MTDHINSLLISLGRASWQGALALLLVGILCRVFARRLPADVHCWLWRLGYGKLFLSLVLSGVVLVPLLSPTPRQLPTFAAPAASVTFQLPASQPTAVVTPNHFAPAVVQAVPRQWLSWQSALTLAYWLGLTVCLSRLCLATTRTRRILRSAVPIADGPETVCAADLAQRIGVRRVPLLARSSYIASPVYVAGTILLPADAQYEEADLRMILAHELAHARRRDLLWEWLGTGMQVVFFFHPFVVLARREERLAREAAADALALQATEGRAADYGEMLLSLSLRQDSSHPRLIGAVGVIEGGSLLHRRLLALRDAAGRTNTARKRRLAFILVPLMALVFIPWKMTHGQAPQQSGPAASTSPQRNASPTPYAYLMPAGNKQINGVVRNEQGQPLAGFTVSLTWNPPEAKPGELIQSPVQARMVLTDAQGRFILSGLPAGNFTYEVQSRTNYDALPRTDSYVTIDAPLKITSTDSRKTLDIAMSTGSLVSGRVIDGQTGKPMAGIFVGAGPIPPGGDLAKWDFWGMPSTGTTDAEGHYQVRVMPGDVFVGVGRITSSTLLSRRVREAVQRVSVEKGQTASAPDLSVFLNPMIVCVGPDGQPVANVPVRIAPDDLGTAGSYLLNDTTDSTGAVVLDRFGNGTFSIVRGHQAASGTFHWAPGQPLVITTAGQTASWATGIGLARLAEATASNITGTVVSEAGTPIPGALIRIVEIDPKSHSALEDHIFIADAAGVFRGTLVAGGEYHAYIRAGGFNQVSVSQKPLAISDGSTTNLGSIHLIHANGFVSGRVVDVSGKPMAGVLASVEGEKTNVSAAVTDDQGRFRIPNVVPDEVLRLELASKGEILGSGTALRQSNDVMEVPGIEASPTEREIVWQPHTLQ